ncbi:hypothetical protein QBC35DRAFT_553184 [Podospora australis]|uniref:C3H1-type domain-containing protein n=1 Tax=Podospora australis TaxID=1536484 RepID=A0AAN6WSL7_9PEZI|nr:hypothetical protein QBC35DRAFT_553184 [Podospora australis]
MLTDYEIEAAAAELVEYQQSDRLSQLLESYSNLLRSYKRLKSDYEEEREAREKYKQMAKHQERNPFVLVLVDGDGYIFNDNLLSQRAAGGATAAQMMNDEIKNSLRHKGLEHCHVMVRVYANVLGLSKALGRANLAGLEARSLAPFIANFNRAYGLTEFVDAGQLKENTDFKLRELLRLYAENSQCKHIYFAACHDVGYISELTPFSGNADKFTLIKSQSARFHDEFSKLGMGVEELRGVFRNSPLDMALPYRPASLESVQVSNPPPVTTKPTPPPVGPKLPATPNGNKKQKVCEFYSAGNCRFGKICKNLHIEPAPDDVSFQSPNIRNVKVSTFSEVAGNSDHVGTTSLARLPKKSDIPSGLVAVNNRDHRLDAAIAIPDPNAIARLRARVEKKRVCNAFHLNGFCNAGNRCEYDHEPLEEGSLSALESLARSQPCPRRAACRNEHCTHGHVCQNPDCKNRGGTSKNHCKLPWIAHHEDFAVAKYVPAVVKSRAVSVADNSSRSSITSF